MGQLNEKEIGNRKRFLGRGYQVAETSRKGAVEVLDILCTTRMHDLSKERTKLRVKFRKIGSRAKPETSLNATPLGLSFQISQIL